MTLRIAPFLLVLAASAAHARSLPPGPVLGQPAAYVIVTPSSFASEFQRLAHWKTRYGVPAVVKPLEEIVAEYPSGRDDAERVRMFLNDASTQWGTQWVLLGGDAPWVPARQVHSAFLGGLDFASDLYFATRGGDWDDNLNGIFGEAYASPSAPGDSVDLTPRLWLGRAPVRSAAEARAFVGKTLLASFEPVVARPFRAVLAAEVLYPFPWTPGTPPVIDGAPYAESVIPTLTAHPDIEITRLYQNVPDPNWPDALPLSHDAVLDALEDGADFVAAITHGTQEFITVGPDLITGDDLAATTNGRVLTRGWLWGSHTGDFTADCVAERWVRTPTGGAVACIAPSNYTFASPTPQYLGAFMNAAFGPAAPAIGVAHAEALLGFIPFAIFDGAHRLHVMDLTLFGDPGTQLYAPPAAAFAVEAPAAERGSTSYALAVTRGALPVPGASVCAIVDDREWVRGSTDVEGRVRLPFASPLERAVLLTVVTPDGGRWSADRLAEGTVGVPSGDLAGPRLVAPSPNPARESIRFAGHAGTGGGAARLEVIDLGGRRVRALPITPGAFELRWDLRDAAGRRVPEGVYFARLIDGAKTTALATRRLIVLR
ncbi:MAG: hypothetical protein HOP12_07225 [Candidatus Eisenbacteria bacterium]|uniref:Gingipain domain-containing protein n=1 Tax=Eiseniibacteriota bacterium TaxID=2212470 RepID=A0A849SHA6_UNCEI|nr:hypothetical protein [Candidatus Eisenbacteria bacterium]